MRLRLQFLVLGVLAGLFASCAQDVVEVEEKKPEVKQDKLVGRVASVYGQEGDGYILIQRYGSIAVEGDKVFYVRSAANQMTSLKMTGERLGQYVAADIVKGAPTVGDPVYLREFEDTGAASSLDHSATGFTADAPEKSPFKPAGQ
ncbi:hypothetical protein SAMN02745181_2464 [Rubritalea squalenifaciens DSM 18772]|uniref:Uncharacterized protein n=1 Tax=Rubritalea squalenifaciens DSM 18772 TaxID=1123071 RepID=A0A1M6LPY1_9BACT|nr:hypothetical protein [Rubritalea squalenifaciens]SHJ73122.1 hypothetical protein SAMN02745181_2464 [Rubritalea squalenifaciens DSM 18772]